MALYLKAGVHTSYYSSPRHYTHLCPFSKSKFNLYEAIKSDHVNLVAPVSPIHRARFSTNWDRKGWPGSEIQMYYDCPCLKDIIEVWSLTNKYSWSFVLWISRSMLDLNLLLIYVQMNYIFIRYPAVILHSQGKTEIKRLSINPQIKSANMSIQIFKYLNLNSDWWARYTYIFQRFL